MSKRRRVEQAEIELIVGLHDSGMTAKQISKAINRNLATVAMVVRNEDQKSWPKVERDPEEAFKSLSVGFDGLTAEERERRHGQNRRAGPLFLACR